MRCNRLTLATSTFVLLVMGNYALAEDSAGDSKLWTGDLELGYVDTSGNTEASTLNSKADVTREKGPWRFTIDYNSLNATANGQRTAEKYFYSNRLAYGFSEHNYAFGYASYEDDRFSGFDYQATVAVGYGRRIIDDKAMQWDAEAGPGYRYDKYDNTSSKDHAEDVILRVYTKFLWNFSENAAFLQSLSVETGANNTISKSSTALKTRIIGAFSLKLSYTIKYTDTVPDDKKHADKETAVTVDYSF